MKLGVIQKIFCFLIVIVCIIQNAEASIEVKKDWFLYKNSLYYYQLDYNNSNLKDSANGWGLYNYFGLGLYTYVEYSYDKLEVESGDNSIEQDSHVISLNRKRFTNYYTLQHWSLGTNIVNSNELSSVNHDATSVWFGWSILNYPKVADSWFTSWGYGFQLISTKQSDILSSLPLPPVSNKLSVEQVSLQANVSSYSTILKGVITRKVTLHHIIVEESNLFEDLAYNSIEYSLSLYKKDWTFVFNLFHGDQLYILKNDGFILLNSEDIYTFGWSLNASYKISNSSNISFNYGYSEYDDSQDNHVDVNVFSLSFNHKF